MQPAESGVQAASIMSGTRLNSRFQYAQTTCEFVSAFVASKLKASAGPKNILLIIRQTSTQCCLDKLFDHSDILWNAVGRHTISEDAPDSPGRIREGRLEHFKRATRNDTRSVAAFLDQGNSLCSVNAGSRLTVVVDFQCHAPSHRRSSSA